MMNVRKIAVAAALAVALGTSVIAGSANVAVAGGPLHGESVFVPSGHTYGPGRTRSPSLNSRRSAIESLADIRQTEIYNYQLRQQRFQERFRNFQNLDNYSPRNSYRY